jgi:hypothetical protein
MPAALAVHGFSRITSTWPTRCSSALIRWLTADGVTCSIAAEASNEPCSVTAAAAPIMANYVAALGVLIDLSNP